ncbi:MAG: hypothetical protein Q9168_006142 [Polycauliona sp. 1 TL-2023]
MNTDNDNILALLDSIKQDLVGPHTATAQHAQTLANISRLQLAVETPLETILRIGYGTWQKACLRIALELGVFDTLSANEGVSVGIQELASASGADAVFLVRIMRVVAALGICEEAGVEKYKANPKTKTMSTPQGVSSFKAWFDIFTPAAAKLPEYMHSKGYQNPTQSTDTAFVYANGSEFWDHLNQTPAHSHIFNDFMSTRRQGRATWYETYPVGPELSSSLSDTDNEIQGEAKVLLVDVGGNRGHDLIEVKAKYPELVGRMIVQDLPHVIAHATFHQDDRMTIEAMPHDFFQPQPIRHALAYHFRAIFHDWSDDACHRILLHTAAAMKRGYSKLLISEFVLPDTDTALFPATLDIQMMGLHGGAERSEEHWRTLLDGAGLRVVKIWQEVKGGEGVIEATLKD